MEQEPLWQRRVLQLHSVSGVWGIPAGGLGPPKGGHSFWGGLGFQGTATLQSRGVFLPRPFPVTLIAAGAAAQTNSSRFSASLSRLASPGAQRRGAGLDGNVVICLPRPFLPAAKLQDTRAMGRLDLASTKPVFAACSRVFDVVWLSLQLSPGLLAFPRLGFACGYNKARQGLSGKFPRCFWLSCHRGREKQLGILTKPSSRGAEVGLEAGFSGSRGPRVLHSILQKQSLTETL